MDKEKSVKKWIKRNTLGKSKNILFNKHSKKYKETTYWKFMFKTNIIRIKHKNSFTLTLLKISGNNNKI